MTQQHTASGSRIQVTALTDIQAQDQGTDAGIALSILDRRDPALQLANGRWIDPLSRHACIAGIAVIPTPEKGDAPIAVAAIDLMPPEGLTALTTLLERAGMVACHDLAPLVAALRLPNNQLRNIHWFDTRVAERALHLRATDAIMLAAERLTGCLTAHRLTGFPFVWSPDLELPLGEPDDAGQMARANRQAVALAAAIAALAAVQLVAMPSDLRTHLQLLEMPAALEHAIISITGVKLDTARCQRLRAETPRMVATLKDRLASTGLADPGSPATVRSWLEKMGVLAAFARRAGHAMVDDDTLKELQHDHPPLRWLRQLRKIEDLGAKPWLAGMLTSSDGRVHPEHLVLQAPTSRTSTRRPELTSLPRQLRPLVIPEPVNGIVELDYKGVEILVAAIRYKDQRLLDAYATGDVISFLAREIFPEELRDLSLREIAEHHDDRRGQSKTIVYGVIYGRKAHSLARSLGVSELVAQLLIDRLLTFCPAVADGMRSMVRHVQRTGRIPIVFGLVRHLTAEERSQPWKVETLAKNTPIQGAAAVVFRWAMVQVARAIEPLGGRIILPVHDAFVLEGPLPEIAIITAAAKQAMIDAFRIISLTAKPLVEVEDSNPSCWCKKGRAESFERYLEDPTAG